MAVNAFIEEYSNAKGFTEYRHVLCRFAACDSARSNGCVGRCTRSIRVTLMRDSWFVHRRFTDFVNLDSDLR